MTTRALASRRIGVIGFGNMASAVIGRVLENNSISPRQVFSLKHKKAKDDKIKAKYKIRVLDSMEELCLKCNTIFLAVKPQQLNDVMTRLQPFHDRQLIITVLAGVKTTTYQKALGRKVKIIRGMPNTPAIVGFGMTGIYSSKSCSKRDLAVGSTLFLAVGKILELKSEKDMDALTAISGSGPAFVYQFAQSMIDAGRKQGLSQAKSKELVVQTLRGATEIMIRSPESPDQLTKRVASKGGSTQAGLDIFKKKRFAQIINSCIVAAVRRNRQLGK